MADVSVRFQVAGDSEIVLNLATADAVRLVQAIMGKVAEAMGTGSMNGAPANGASMGTGAISTTQRAPIGAGWPDVPANGSGFPPGR
jgi:hypothetical protein